jgi:hypothetical protein
MPYDLNGYMVIERVARKVRMSSKNTTRAKSDSHIKLTIKRSKSVNLLEETGVKFKKLSNEGLQGRLIIEVSGTGCGMVEEETKKLFQPFVQVNKNVEEKFGGTGLGLWFSHKLITAMNGSIACKSQLNKGTTFTAKLDINYKEDDIGTVHSIFKDSLRAQDAQDVTEVINSLKNSKGDKYAVLTGLKSVHEIEEKSKAEIIGLRYSQIVIITRMF